MQNAGKDRLVMTGLVLAVLPFVICSVACTYRTLEAFLNLVWVVLAFGVFVHWAVSGNGRSRVYPHGFVSLVFALSLLFPVISANDDLLQLDLIDDTQTSQRITASLKSDKRLAGSAGADYPAALLTKVHSLPPLLLTSEPVFDLIQPFCVAIPGGATGNHSPPVSLI